MDAIPYVDSLVKEYLLFRGFTGSLRALNKELASDRGCGFQADQLCELVFRKLLPLDQASELMEVLDFLSKRVYSRLPGSYEDVIRKLEVANPHMVQCVLAKDKTGHFNAQSASMMLAGVHTTRLHCQRCSSGKAGCCTTILFPVWTTPATKGRVV